MTTWAARLGQPHGWPGSRVDRALRRLRRLPRTAHAQKIAGAGLKGAACAGCVVAAAAVSTTPPAPNRPQGKSWRDFGHPTRRVTDILLVLNAVCYCLQILTQDALTIWGAKVNALIAMGQLWRLVTPMFLHSGLFHLVINCHALHTLGPLTELVSGHARFATVYLASGVAGTVASYLLTPAPSLGASAAVFGIGAALGMYYHRHRHLYGSFSEQMLKSLGATVVLNAVYSLINKRLDNWGHLGGMLAGAAMSYLLGPKLVVTREGLQDLPPVPLMAGLPHLPQALEASSMGSSAASSSVSSSSITSGPVLQRPMSAKERHWLEWKAEQDRLLARRAEEEGV